MRVGGLHRALLFAAALTWTGCAARGGQPPAPVAPAADSLSTAEILGTSGPDEAEPPPPQYSTAGADGGRLNWRWALFFLRVKRRVAEHWKPESEYRRRDPQGSVYGNQNRYTELRVHLEPDGRLAGAEVIVSSGLPFLDEAGVRAFQEAQPFPDPPREFIDEGGTFRFGFLFDLARLRTDAAVGH
jgi:TonB family protein